MRLRKTGDILRISGIGQLVEHGYAHVRMVVCHVAHEIGSDKPTSAGHDDVARLENLTTHHFRVPAGLHHGALVGDVSNH